LIIALTRPAGNQNISSVKEGRVETMKLKELRASVIAAIAIEYP
jgi:hypothetical protein